WINAMQLGMTESQVQTTILESDEFYQHVGMLFSGGPSNSSYVLGLYSAVLGRTPTSGELNSWTMALASQSRSIVATAFVNSQEFRSDVIRGYYMSILHRSTSPAAAEVNGWAISGLDFSDIRIAFETSAEFMQH